MSVPVRPYKFAAHDISAEMMGLWRNGIGPGRAGAFFLAAEKRTRTVVPGCLHSALSESAANTSICTAAPLLASRGVQKHHGVDALLRLTGASSQGGDPIHWKTASEDSAKPRRAGPHVPPPHDPPAVETSFFSLGSHQATSVATREDEWN
jgi:hypothetical protein